MDLCHQSCSFVRPADRLAVVCLSCVAITLGITYKWQEEDTAQGMGLCRHHPQAGNKKREENCAEQPPNKSS